MSERALLLAVVQQLNTATTDPDAPGLGLDRKHCWIAPERGKPPGSCGEMFIGVWQGATRGDRRPMKGLSEYFSVNVTITMRANGQYPFDRWGDWVTSTDTEALRASMNDLIGRVRLCIHQDSCDHRVIRRANNILAAENFPSTGFTEPLVYQGCGELEFASRHWFSSDEKRGRIHGIINTLRFGDCRRVQKFNDPAGMS